MAADVSEEIARKGQELREMTRVARSDVVAH